MWLSFDSLYFLLSVPPTLERTILVSGASPRENLALCPTLAGFLITWPTTAPCSFLPKSLVAYVLLIVPIPWLPS